VSPIITALKGLNKLSRCNCAGAKNGALNEAGRPALSTFGMFYTKVKNQKIRFLERCCGAIAPG